MINEKMILEQTEQLKQSQFADERFISGVTAVEILIDFAPKTGEWIPCSERLPEESGFYVVTKRQRSGEIQVALGSYRPLFNEWSGNGNFKDVIAWMPLPEPYKEGGAV